MKTTDLIARQELYALLKRSTPLNRKNIASRIRNRAIMFETLVPWPALAESFREDLRFVEQFNPADPAPQRPW